MITMNEVAKNANVSRATVSRVLSGHPSVTAETRANVMYWVKKLDYKPNIIAQSLVGNKSQLLGVIVPNLSNPFFAEIVDAIEEEAMNLGYGILIASHSGNIQKENNVINTFLNRRVDGIIIIPVKRAVSIKHLKTIKIPVISITKTMEDIDSVSMSHNRAIELIVKHMIELGHEKVGYIGKLNSEKSNSLIEITSKYGLKITDVIELDTGNNYDDYEKIKKEIQEKSLESTILFAHNDIVAADTVQALKDLGYDIPSEIAVIGFDNTILSRKLDPKLTSIAQPTKEIGSTAVNHIIDKINGLTEELLTVKLEPRLIVRDTTVKKNVEKRKLEE